jgi:hypothetical protein
MEQRILENPVVTRVVQKFPAFYGTRRFIAVFIAAHEVMLKLILKKTG